MTDPSRVRIDLPKVRLVDNDGCFELDIDGNKIAGVTAYLISRDSNKEPATLTLTLETIDLEIDAVAVEKS